MIRRLLVVFQVLSLLSLEDIILSSEEKNLLSRVVNILPTPTFIFVDDDSKETNVSTTDEANMKFAAYFYATRTKFH